MIIITPEKFNYFGLIPHKFKYFSLNPETNQLYDLEKIKLGNIFTSSDLDNIISFQKRLCNTNFPHKILPNSLKYDLNFKFTQRLLIESIKREINKNTKKEVAYIDEFKKHKSMWLYLIFLYSKIKIEISLKPLLVILFSLSRVFFLIFERKFNLFITNKNQLKNITDNLKTTEKNILCSNNIFKRNSLSIDSIIFVFSTLTLPFNLLELVYTRFRHKKLFEDFSINSKSIYFSLAKYNFSRFLCQILKFNLYTISNYGISEAFNLNSKKHNNIIINHGVYYFDLNKMANEFWRFHSLTMIQCLNSRIVSNNQKDFDFIKKNNFNLDYSFKENTLREKRVRIVPKNEKVILIADTFKSHNFLRPLLYNNVFEYLTFINDICESAPKEYEIILRHRPNTIISENFILKNNKRLKPSNNRDIYIDFLNDPIVIGFTSTVLFESSQLGLRSISFDPYNRNIEFLNFPLYNNQINVSNRFSINVKGKKNLKHLLCKI